MVFSEKVHVVITPSDNKSNLIIPPGEQRIVLHVTHRGGSSHQKATSSFDQSTRRSDHQLARQDTSGLKVSIPEWLESLESGLGEKLFPAFDEIGFEDTTDLRHVDEEVLNALSVEL